MPEHEVMSGGGQRAYRGMRTVILILQCAYQKPTAMTWPPPLIKRRERREREQRCKSHSDKATLVYHEHLAWTAMTIQSELYPASRL